MRLRSSIPMLTALLAGIFAAAAYAAVPPKKGKVFSCQGQSPYRFEERSKSQKQAVQAFLAHGVSQALASLPGSSASTEGARAARERILRQPERYIESHRILSEGPSKGVYRVSGQVTVNMEALTKELRAASASPNVPGAPARPPSEPSRRSDASPVTTGQVAAPPAPPARGIVLAKPALFWAVTERWEDRWVLPENDRDRQSLFARSLLQETEDFHWTLAFAGSDRISPDPDGTLPLERVTELAREAGARYAVMGSVTTPGTRSQTGDPAISLNVRLLEVETGKLLADVHKETSVEGGALEAAVMRLAEAVATQLDRSVQDDSGPPAEAQGAARRSEPPGRPEDEWVLTLRGDQHFAAWGALQNALRERFSAMTIKRVDVSTDETQAAVAGIEADFFSPSQELALAPAFRIRVDSLSSEPRRVVLSVQGQSTGGGAPSESRP